MQSGISKLEAERAEVDDILSSGVFGRTSNPARLLTFVCERYFEGAIDQIKEYTIAVQALGRPESFDPHVDTVVRVTAHALRKRLEDYYKTAGVGHAVQICLPPGHYVPKFIHRSSLEASTGESKQEEDQNGESRNKVPSRKNGEGEEHEVASAPPIRDSEQHDLPRRGNDPRSIAPIKPRTRTLAVVAVFAISVFILSGYVWRKGSARNERSSTLTSQAAAVPDYAIGQALRVMAGDSSVSYVDRDGFTWDRDRFCSGGSTFSIAGHTIQGTDDPVLFTSGRRGIFHCNYRVPAGTYEVHLLFAETSELQENSRNVIYSINGGPVSNLDVVDDAGGDDIATAKIFTDVKPQNDGTIHLDFISPNSFVNAVEILPGTPHRMLPVRVVMGHSPYRDSDGNVWMSDRYFFGGRLSSFGGDLSKVPDARLYEWHRFGHFHYVLPVVPGGKYTVRLFFMEHWFGAPNGGIGGAGSRVFDVYCNGSTLLKGFDIFREAGSGPLIKSFPHIEPTPDGQIDISFIPGLNYPSVSAIEVLAE